MSASVNYRFARLPRLILIVAPASSRLSRYKHTGYPEKSCAKLRALGLNHDFYLAHGLQQPKYSKDWRLFYPKDFR
jgi:hypothetical protein